MTLFGADAIQQTGDHATHSGHHNQTDRLAVFFPIGILESRIEHLIEFRESSDEVSGIILAVREV